MNEQLIRMVGSVNGAEIVNREFCDERVRVFPMCLLGRTNTTLVVRKRREPE